jgi:hypothetical protein
MSRYTRKLFLILLLARVSFAGIISGGLISQSTSDGTGPAVNNLSLNNIHDGDAYQLTLNSLNSIVSPGLYNTPDLTLGFVDLTAGVRETAFSSVSLSIVTDGSFFDISVLGCLSTGSGCNVGNELDANFRIANTDLQSVGAAAFLIPALNPSLDLLEDDGVTDIQGSVTSFANASVPEPSLIGLVALGFAALIIRKRVMG